MSSTITSPEQTSSKEWHGIRMKRFTASVHGKLHCEPKKLPTDIIARYENLLPIEHRFKTLKSGLRKGQIVRADGFESMLREVMDAHGVVLFGDTADALIAGKAVEAHSGIPMHTARTRSMDRGTLLEHAARILMSRYCFEIDTVTFQPLGDDSGATPDGMVGGRRTWQCKCPEQSGDLLRFARQVPEGDFDALVEWNKDYAWQIMVEALASGTDTAAITLFTDRLNATAVKSEEIQLVQDVMDAVANHLGDQLGYPMYYRYEGTGFAQVTRTFTLTAERIKKIERINAAAVIERVRYQEEIEMMA